MGNPDFSKAEKIGPAMRRSSLTAISIVRFASPCDKIWAVISGKTWLREA
jgi:hypothetical protein